MLRVIKCHAPLEADNQVGSNGSYLAMDNERDGLIHCEQQAQDYDHILSRGGGLCLSWIDTV